MTIDLRTASVDEMRDWLAEQGVGGQCSCGNHGCSTSLTRIPATLDAIAAVWRTELVGWWWARWGVGVWVAQRAYGASALPKDVDSALIKVPDTGDELADRLRLTCLALAAERNIQ